MSKSRRAFLTQAITLTAGLGLAGPGALAGKPARREKHRLTILHTNDVHSRIEPFPEDGGKYAGLGGMARRASLIQKIREKEEQVLLLDAGDYFQGTPYFNLFGGELEFKMMNSMGYDACTIGNHDFDGGIERLAELSNTANFDILCSNYELGSTPLDGKVKSFKIFQKGQIKVGIFGLGIELKGLVPSPLFGETQYLNPVAVAQKTAAILKGDFKCDLVICLSHLGLRYATGKVSDQVVATETNDIDLIIGGHTHTFLNQPMVFKNTKGQPVLVNQAGWAGIVLGRLDVEFFPEKQQRNFFFTPVIVDKKSTRF